MSSLWPRPHHHTHPVRFQLTSPSHRTLLTPLHPYDNNHPLPLPPGLHPFVTTPRPLVPTRPPVRLLPVAANTPAHTLFEPNPPVCLPAPTNEASPTRAVQPMAQYLAAGRVPNALNSLLGRDHHLPRMPGSGLHRQVKVLWRGRRRQSVFGTQDVCTCRVREPATSPNLSPWHMLILCATSPSPRGRQHSQSLRPRPDPIPQAMLEGPFSSLLWVFLGVSWRVSRAFPWAERWGVVAFLPGCLSHFLFHGDGADAGANASEESARRPHQDAAV